MTWDRLLSSKRIAQHTSAPPTAHARTPYESDVDRIVFSNAFRRLSRKTQVHPLAANDHIHNRLSHSLEVARVGASLGKAVGNAIKKDLPTAIEPQDLSTIVHAACLAHDIGNPPFGHAGESAIKNWFISEGTKILPANLQDKLKTDLYNYEGNAQGFRILTQTENHFFDGGLRLTAATLGTFLKYPWTSEYRHGKFGAYLSEEEILASVAEETGMIRLGDHNWCRHPLAYLVEAADDICYGIIDLEDAVELRIISFEDAFEALSSCFDEERKIQIRNSFAPNDAYRVNLSRLRGAVMDELIFAAVEAFKDNYDSIMQGQFNGDLFSALPSNDSRRQTVQNAKALAAKRIFGTTVKVELELGSASTYACLLQNFCEAAVRCATYLSDTENTTLDWKSKLVLRLLGDHSPLVSELGSGTSWSSYSCVRRVLDFVGGMTDNYAIHIAQQIQGAGFTARKA